MNSNESQNVENIANEIECILKNFKKAKGRDLLMEDIVDVFGTKFTDFVDLFDNLDDDNVHIFDSANLDLENQKITFFCYHPDDEFGERVRVEFVMPLSYAGLPRKWDINDFTKHTHPFGSIVVYLHKNLERDFNEWKADEMVRDSVDNFWLNYEVKKS